MSEFIEPESLEEVVISDKVLEAPKVKAKAPRKPKNVKLAPLDTTFEEEELVEECTPVKKSRGRPQKVKEPVAQDDQDASPPKPKRVQTDKQKLNFIKALETRKKNIELRRVAKELEKEVKEAQLETKKKEVERKVIKKAVCLKKKEILSQACLEDISDEEIPDEIVQKIVKKQRAKSAPKPVEPVEPPAPKYNFV